MVKPLRRAVASISASASASAGGTCGRGLPRLVLGLLIGTTFLLCALAVLWLFRQPPAGARRAEGFEARGRDSRLVYLRLQKCGWCERFQPTWDELVRRDGADLKRRGVRLESYEASEAGAQPLNQHAQGYPALLFVTEGREPVLFEGERTREGVLAFVAGELAAQQGGGADAERFEVERVSSGADQLASSVSATISHNQVPNDTQRVMRALAGAKLPNPYA